MKRYFYSIATHITAILLSIILGVFVSYFVFEQSARIGFIIFVPSFVLFFTTRFLTGRTWISAVLPLIAAWLCYLQSKTSFDGNWSNAFVTACAPVYVVAYFLSTVFSILSFRFKIPPSINYRDNEV